MATMVIGSKTGIFHLNKTLWKCRTELGSDVVIDVEDFSFFLHKFPLMNASPVLRKLIGKNSHEEHNHCNFTLHEIPGGPHSFEHAVKFCYGEKFELTSSNVVPILCAAYYLDMNEDYMAGNLISQAENFLSNKVLSNWKESITALLSCEPVFNFAEKIDVVSKCLDSLACKVTYGKLSYPPTKPSWNGIVYADAAPLKLKGTDLNWWHDDVSSLSLPLFKRLIGLLGAKGHDPENISSAVIYYWNKVHPGLVLDSTGVYVDDLRILLEEMVALLPVQKGVTPTKTLLSMLSTSLMYNASSACIESLEKRIGAQLDESTLEDLLVPNLQGPNQPNHASSKKNESKYDMDCIQRIIEQFVEENLNVTKTTSDLQDDENPMEAQSHELNKVAAVAKLVDEYLMKISTEAHLDFRQFQSLAGAIPASARSSNDDLYYAIDVYLQYHADLSEQQKEQLCQLVDMRKLSRDACRHVALNEKLPLRVVVKVLFIELIHLKSSLGEHEAEALIGPELTAEIETETENEIDNSGRREMLWQRLKLHRNYETLKKLIKKLEKAKEARKNWSVSFCKNMESVRIFKMLPASRGQQDAA
ncbi:hypothetical protein LUZ61_016209 [Rhynchospora tenuis]|uniref:Phototropic-responsive NPH3 family protein n=1 Tax=Rhynchospora tenuis TaxID=198213 RepID=A0AAD6EJP4_9POAL|nr:hypothetical protein LUZ61_016209 [Rhynchospora tenuis]